MDLESFYERSLIEMRTDGGRESFEDLVIPTTIAQKCLGAERTEVCIVVD